MVDILVVSSEFPSLFLEVLRKVNIFGQIEVLVIKYGSWPPGSIASLNTSLRDLYSKVLQDQSY